MGETEGPDAGGTEAGRFQPSGSPPGVATAPAEHREFASESGELPKRLPKVVLGGELPPIPSHGPDRYQVLPLPRGHRSTRRAINQTGRACPNFCRGSFLRGPGRRGQPRALGRRRDSGVLLSQLWVR
jgi:hypothetical protein